jgi:Tfp pilus assembly protein PilZ
VHHAVAVNEMLTVVRPDRGRAVHARVAWIHPTEPQTADVGIEFLDAENFWEVDWTKSTPF